MAQLMEIGFWLWFALFCGVVVAVGVDLLTGIEVAFCLTIVPLAIVGLRYIEEQRNKR
jgi:archaellum biogenesis protein FlaJ (TadC family)